MARTKKNQIDMCRIRGDCPYKESNSICKGVVFTEDGMCYMPSDATCVLNEPKENIADCPAAKSLHPVS